jgi:hypothetical protein
MAGGLPLRFVLKEPAHPAAGGTPLLKRIDALPLNTSYNFETASSAARFFLSFWPNGD